ncbi:MAG: secretin N-terminal domain-containing protein, partial [Acidobacteriota bacterium]
VAVTLVATIALPPSLSAGEGAKPGIELRTALHDVDFPEPVSARDVYRAIGRAHDLHVIFDPDYKDRDIALQLDGVTWREAFDAAGQAGGHFWTRQSDGTLLIAADTPQKRRQYEPIEIARFTLDHIEVKDAMTIVRSLVGAKHIAADEDPRSLVVRDSTARVEVVRRLLAELDQPNDEVQVRVQLLRLPRTDLRRLTADGIQVERQVIDRLVEQQRAQSLLGALVGLRGAKSETVEMTAANRQDPTETFGFSARVAGRVDRESQEVQLDLAVEMARRGADANRDGEPDLLDSRELSSAWRVADGQTALVEMAYGPLAELGGTVGTDSDAVVLALTPTVTRFGTASRASSFAVGTESRLRLAQRSAMSPAARAEVRERLRERLNNLPRGLQPNATGDEKPVTER